ncbi:MAG: hypothetical protein WC477_06950 [Patescibacteria group bacterium]
MELTAKNVESVLVDCLFNEGEPTDSAVKVAGAVSLFGFNPERLKNHKEDIVSMLMQLPEEFVDNGWSFLNACTRRDGEQWGQHADIDKLLCLGLAVGRVEIPLPREAWAVLPGGMPYFIVLSNDR